MSLLFETTPDGAARYLDWILNGLCWTLCLALGAWIIALVVGTFVGVARPYIAGGLSAPATDDGWVMTTYLAANAFILPITGWLSAHAR